MKRKKIILLAMAVGMSIVTTSCYRYVAAPYTDVMQISQIKPAMKFKRVVDILGIEPYDIYHVQENGAMLVSFNYRLKKRIMKVNTLNYDEYVRETTNENSQTAGDLYYDKKYKTLFVLFNEQGEVTSYITSDGLDKSHLIVITGNTIKIAKEKDITLLDPAFSPQIIKIKEIQKSKGD